MQPPSPAITSSTLTIVSDQWMLGSTPRWCPADSVTLGICHKHRWFWGGPDVITHPPCLAGPQRSCLSPTLHVPTSIRICDGLAVVFTPPLFHECQGIAQLVDVPTQLEKGNVGPVPAGKPYHCSCMQELVRHGCPPAAPPRLVVGPCLHAQGVREGELSELHSKA